jgi:VanZ family protein
MNHTDKHFLTLEPACAGFESMKFIRTVFWSFAIAIVVQAILPINGANSKLNQSYFFLWRLDYLAHIAMFASLSVLLRLAYFPQAGSDIRRELIFFGVMVFAGISSEAVQLFVRFRAFNINDLIANFLGIVVGIPLTWLCRVIVSPRQKRVQSATKDPF